MNIRVCAGALALGVAMTPAAASADDPHDPSMRSAAARARDAAIIRRLNQEQLAFVQNRDAQYAQGWRAYREGPRVAPAQQAEYAREMVTWRHAVAQCRAGHYEYCMR